MENSKKPESRDIAEENLTNISRSPFSQDKLNEIFKISSVAPDRLVSRESSTVEFKESFGWKGLAKYLKTCAAFANTKGGYLVFGIGSNPHSLLGLSENSLRLFEENSPEKLTGHFNDFFAPEIHWEMREYELHGNNYGIIYIYESIEKPVICKKETDTVLKEGDIYYRYRGRSERIKYSELRDILEDKRKAEQRLWMRHLARVARVGVRDAGIFDLKTGQVSGATNSFFIDESLLSQLSFIKEGEFSEEKGKSALKLIGDAQVVDGSRIVYTKKIIETKWIRPDDIILTFLNLGPVHKPLEYIKQICFENTGFLPVYYYIKLSHIIKEKVITEINEVISRSQSKSKLLKRLEGNNFQSIKKPTSDTAIGKNRDSCINQICQSSIDPNINGKELRYCLQSIRMLQPKEVSEHSKYIRGLLITWLKKHYLSEDGTIADNLRRSICWVDEALFALDTNRIEEN